MIGCILFGIDHFLIRWMAGRFSSRYASAGFFCPLFVETPGRVHIDEKTQAPHRQLPASHRPPSATPARQSIGFVPQQPASIAEPDDGVTYDDASHILTHGKTGAGKTVHIIGNTLSYAGSMIIFDSKGDIYQATARRRREMGQEVHVIDLRDSARCGDGSINPLDLAVRSGTEEAVIARSLAAHIVARTGEERDAFWNNWAETCIAGAIGYVMGLPAESRHIGSVFDLFNGDDSSIAWR